jgi:GMP synthase-like glutamine amidotransferase
MCCWFSPCLSWSSRRSNKPVLGVCLGAQLIARTFGGRVFKTQEDSAHTATPVPIAAMADHGVEFGYLRQDFTPAARADPLLGPALAESDASHFQQWHEDTFSLPASATALSTRPTVPAQSFRIGESTYGFQCHIEVGASLARTWIDWLGTGRDCYQPMDEWQGRLTAGEQRALLDLMDSAHLQSKIGRAEHCTSLFLRSWLEACVQTRRRGDRARVGDKVERAARL